jgi:hypothetical protein
MINEALISSNPTITTVWFDRVMPMEKVGVQAAFQH